MVHQHHHRGDGNQTLGKLLFIPSKVRIFHATDTKGAEGGSVQVKKFEPLESYKVPESRSWIDHPLYASWQSQA